MVLEKLVIEDVVDKACVLRLDRCSGAKIGVGLLLHIDWVPKQFAVEVILAFSRCSVMHAL